MWRPVAPWWLTRVGGVAVAFTNIITVNGDGLIMSILHTNVSGGFYRLQAEIP